MMVQITTSGIVVSDMVNGYYTHCFYQGYSKHEALKMFRADYKLTK